MKEKRGDMYVNSIVCKQLIEKECIPAREIE
jgi:hypothetical protein